MPFENILLTADMGSFAGGTWLVFVCCEILPAGRVRKVSVAGSSWLAAAARSVQPPHTSVSCLRTTPSPHVLLEVFVFALTR